MRRSPRRCSTTCAAPESWRGARRPAVDRAAIVSMLIALGRLGVDRPDILEIDLNPVIASVGGAIAVDALVMLEGM